MHDSGGDNRAETVVVAETVQFFITTMDALKLNQTAVDEIQPLVSDLVHSLNKVSKIFRKRDIFTAVIIHLDMLITNMYYDVNLCKPCKYNHDVG
jgi:hypothetical protein